MDMSENNDFQKVVNGETVVINNEQIIKESDTPSYYLQGSIPNAKSSEVSEEPGFHVISDFESPKGLYPTKEDRIKIQNESFKRYEYDTHYRAIIDSFLFFIIGKGLSVVVMDENPEVQKYLDDFLKVNKFNGRDRQIIAKFLKTGECFLRLFTMNNGKPARIPTVRCLNYWQIDDIITDENDMETILEYKRLFKDSDDRIQIESVKANEIIHFKFADYDDKRGVPPFAVAVQACQFYSDWLMNRVVLNRLKTSYYLEEIVDGSPTTVTTQDDTTPDQYKTSRSGKLIKRMPKFGSKITHNKSVEYKWLAPKVEADDAKEDGRAIRLSIASGAQVPEFIFGDAANANFASTLVAQNPFVRKIEFFQDLFSSYFESLFETVIRYGIENKFLPSMSTETITREKNAGFIRRLKAKVSLKEQIKNGNVILSNLVPTKTSVKITWPTLITENILQDSQAAQIHQSMDIISKETLAQKFGYDYQEELRKIKKEQEDRYDEDESKDGFSDDERDEEIERKETV